MSGFTFGRQDTSAPTSGTTGGFSFGAPSSTPSFGAASTPSFGFGTSAPSSSSTPSFGFGAPTTSASTPSFGFGTGTTAASTPAFGFGSSAASTASSTPAFGFGATTASSAAASSTPSFGFGTGTSSTFASSTPAFGTGTSSTFGAASTPAFGTGTSSAFGTSSTFGAASTPSFGFGTTATTPITRQSTALPGIGTSGLGGGFSFSTPSLTSGSTPTLFSASSSTFAPSTTSAFSFTPLSSGQAPLWGATTSMKPPPLTPQQRIQSIADSYNPNSADCKFRHMMYNKVDPSEIDKYSRPANVNERLWNQAVEANPDPSRLVPVQATGFQDLKLRIDEQDKTTAGHQKALEDLQKFIVAMQRKHDLDTVVKIEKYKRTHLELAHRVIGVMKKIEVLRSKGYSITVDEEHFKAKLESLQRELNMPNLYKGKLNELSSFVRMLDERPQMEHYIPLDNDSLESIHNFLSQQQKGLFHLTNILKKDLRDIQLIQDFLTERSKSDMVM